MFLSYITSCVIKWKKKKEEDYIAWIVFSSSVYLYKYSRLLFVKLSISYIIIILNKKVVIPSSSKKRNTCGDDDEKN